MDGSMAFEPTAVLDPQNRNPFSGPASLAAQQPRPVMRTKHGHTMKLKVIKLLSLLLSIWVLLCFCVSAYLYFNKPLLSASHLERTSYGTINGQPTLDDIDLTINKVNEGSFSGFATLTLRTEEAKKAYSKSERTYILLEGVHASNFMPQLPNWLELKSKREMNGRTVLVTENNIEIYDSGDDFNYPFDSYLIELSFEMQMYYGKDYEKFEKAADSASVLFDLPKNFIVQRLKKIPNTSCNYMDCEDKYLDDVHEDELLHKVTRASWLRWFTLGLVSVIFAPIILLINAKVESINIDILASIVSIFAVRAFLLGTTTKIYALDFIFGFAALFVVLIPMIKIIAMKEGAHNKSMQPTANASAD